MFSKKKTRDIGGVHVNDESFPNKNPVTCSFRVTFHRPGDLAILQSSSGTAARGTVD